ncbi:DJ-1/PfpI family protein [Candidatus Babeliales bacterium]|nr:DJ-1/PfpI family protein [Candidatus Babeliales bacterium]
MNKRILFVLMPLDFQDVEFTEPYTMLTAQGYHVDVAGFKPGPARGTQGYEFTPNLLLGDMDTQDFDSYDAIVIPGGKASPQFLWDNEELQDIVRYFHDYEKIVAAICYASIVPVQAGLLQNKDATVYPTDEAKAILEEYDVIFVDSECVVLPEERIITCQGPQAAQTFGQAILNLLEGE